MATQQLASPGKPLAVFGSPTKPPKPKSVIGLDHRPGGNPQGPASVDQIAELLKNGGDKTWTKRVLGWLKSTGAWQHLDGAQPWILYFPSQGGIWLDRRILSTLVTDADTPTNVIASLVLYILDSKLSPNSPDTITWRNLGDLHDPDAIRIVSEWIRSPLSN